MLALISDTQEFLLAFTASHGVRYARLLLLLRSQPLFPLPLACNAVGGGGC
jgi:hypothetical protein